MKRVSSSSQSGSAFFIILVGIVIFAMLTYAVFRGGSTSGGTMERDQAKLAAQEIISYGDSVATAVQTLKLRGCTDSQISFAGNGGLSRSSTGVAFNYTNTQAPGDGSCDIFTQTGGKIVAQNLSQGYIDPSLLNAAQFHSASFYFSGACIQGVGTDTGTATSMELVMWYGRLKKEVCLEINKILGVNTDSGNFTVDSYTTTAPFTGFYAACPDPMGDAATYLAGKTAFCSQTSNDEKNYIFFRVLIAR